MVHPEWIDADLSESLPVLRDRGEGQHIEFMEVYPSNGHELSKEIAAFASSNAGTILIGVADDGSVVGLDDLDSTKRRDQLCRRIEGVCSGNVRPAITPAIKFAKEGDAVILAIEVPRGSQPVYYSKNTPYVRHLTRSRPAEPHEVIERISEWLAKNPHSSVSEDTGSQFLSTLAATLIDVLIYGSEFEQRNANPWLDLVRTQLASAGEELRRLASEDVALDRSLDQELRRLADLLDSAASHRLTMGRDSWNTLEGYVTEAVSLAQDLKATHIDTVPLSDAAQQKITKLVRRSARELSDLSSRAQEIAEDGRIEELKEAASEIGRSLLIASYYLSPRQEDTSAEEVREIGRGLHLIETERLQMDGGQSMNRIVDTLHDITSRLNALVMDRYQAS